MTSPSALENPYLSPNVDDAVPAPAMTPKNQAIVSGAIAFGGVIVFLFGYFLSMICLFGIFLDQATTILPLSLAMHWLVYVLAVMLAVTGAIMVGSQPMQPMLAVIYFMCPIAAVALAAGYPLRTVSKCTQAVSIAYLMLGTCLAATAMIKMLALTPGNDESVFAILGNIMIIAGLALVVGAGIRLMKMPTASIEWERPQLHQA